jgi:hypothetical protein
VTFSDLLFNGILFQLGLLAGKLLLTGFTYSEIAQNIKCSEFWEIVAPKFQL